VVWRTEPSSLTSWRKNTTSTGLLVANSTADASRSISRVREPNRPRSGSRLPAEDPCAPRSGWARRLLQTDGLTLVMLTVTAVPSRTSPVRRESAMSEPYAAALDQCRTPSALCVGLATQSALSRGPAVAEEVRPGPPPSSGGSSFFHLGGPRREPGRDLNCRPRRRRACAPSSPRSARRVRPRTGRSGTRPWPCPWRNWPLAGRARARGLGALAVLHALR